MHPIDSSFQRMVDEPGKPYVLRIYNREGLPDVMVAIAEYAITWLRHYAPPTDEDDERA